MFRETEGRVPASNRLMATHTSSLHWPEYLIEAGAAAVEPAGLSGEHPSLALKHRA